MSIKLPTVNELPCGIVVANVQQCATATCDESGQVQRCIDAGNYTLTLDNPTEAEIATAQATVDAQALAAAVALAEAGVPHLTSGTPPAAQKGVAYSFTFTAAGGTGPYTYAVTSGTLPAGLVLTSGGLLHGTPTESGGFDITVTVTDSSP